MIRVLIAEDNEQTRCMLIKFLSSKSEIRLVGAACDGREAECMLKKADVDVLLLDLVMPVVDGYELLSRLEASQREKKPRVIVLSSLMSDEAIQRAMYLGASYYMLKPYDPELLYNRIVEFGYTSDAVPEDTVTTGMRVRRVGQVLHELGVPIASKGYDYLRMTLEMTQANRANACRVTKEIYPAVAKCYATNPYAVERAIRGAIERAWDRGVLKETFGREICKRPSNGEFIARAQMMMQDT